MNPARVTPEDYIQFLIGSPRVVSVAEAARVRPDRPKAPAHDAYNRLLHRLEPDPAALWGEVRPLLDLLAGVLVIDDSTLDKPRAEHIDLVGYHWSGNRHAVVRGINLITLLWSGGDRLYPTDYRVYHKAGDRETKNDHFADLLRAAHARGLRPRAVPSDGWYGGVDNLELVRDLGRTFVTRFQANRKVRIDRGEAKAVGDQPIAAAGTVVWLPGYGAVRVFRVVAPDGDTAHWATNDLGMDEPTRLAFGELSWSIEEYHRGLKQFTGVDRCHVRAARGQRNHIGWAIRAFVRLEYHRFTTGISWFAAKWAIVREAARRYLEQPRYRLPDPAAA
ncbi:MAG: transposase [Gemmataceae bacterium]|nr:transposase [Gemmataceae bacterium]